MNSKNIIILFIFLLVACDGAFSPEYTKGCTIPEACNFDSDAVIYDDSCTYASDDGEGNYMGNSIDGENSVFDCEGVCLVDSDADGFCEDFDICPDDPLNECLGGPGSYYFTLEDCYSGYFVEYYIELYADGTGIFPEAYYTDVSWGVDLPYEFIAWQCPGRSMDCEFWFYLPGYDDFFCYEDWDDGLMTFYYNSGESSVETSLIPADFSLSRNNHNNLQYISK